MQAAHGQGSPLEPIQTGPDEQGHTPVMEQGQEHAPLMHHEQQQEHGPPMHHVEQGHAPPLHPGQEQQHALPMHPEQQQTAALQQQEQPASIEQQGQVMHHGLAAPQSVQHAQAEAVHQSAMPAKPQLVMNSAE